MSARTPSSRRARAKTSTAATSQSDRAEQRRREALARRRGAVALFLGVIVVFIALMVARHEHAPSHGTAATTAKDPSYAVGLVNCTFVDHSRSTPDFANGTTLPSRTLVTQIRYPSLAADPSHGVLAKAKPAKVDGPFPLIVFGHGYDLTPSFYEPLLDAWVKAGFVVAAPLFPDTNASAVGADADSSIGESDDINQPGDVAFVTRAVLADAQRRASACPALAGLINAAQLGLAGQSDGAETIAALAYDSGYRQAGLAFKAAAVLSGQEFLTSPGKPDPYRADAHDPALLVVQSATDQCNPPQDSVKLYNDISQSDKWFLKLDDADHLPPYSGADPSAFGVVSDVTTRFFQLELSGQSPGASFLALGNAHPSVASIFHGASAPVLPSLLQVPSTCYLGA